MSDMLVQVFKNEAVDVNVIGTPVEKGVFKLARFTEDTDYCDLVGRAWIWSIGRHKQSGEIRASTDTRFYNNSEYECLFLR